MERTVTRTFIGIDNGVSGAITILDERTNVIIHINTPIKNHLNYLQRKRLLKM